MKKIIVLIIVFSLVFVSCKKREVKIPFLAINGAEEISNNSQIWMFYNEKDGSIKVNEKNRISTTHWLFNIDKRLKIKDVLSEANRLLIKHREKSPHNEGGMNNYFSYVNTLNKKWSFYQFDSIQYRFSDQKTVRNYAQKSDTALIKISDKNIDFRQFNENKNLIFQAAFIDELTFQEYMSIKEKIAKSLPVAQTSPIEYIISN